VTTLDWVLAQGRTLQESTMTATCNVQRKTGQTVYNPVTHQDEPVIDTIFTGPCRVQPARIATAEEVQMFGQQINSLTMVGALPVTMADLLPDDVIAITASLDPGQVGKKYTVQAVQTSSAATARRFIAVDNEG